MLADVAEIGERVAAVMAEDEEERALVAHLHRMPRMCRFFTCK